VRWYVPLLILILEQFGCTRGLNTVAGRITPEHFRFKTVVEIPKRNKSRPDGWQAVCVDG
jgi:hypothetical protein